MNVPKKTRMYIDVILMYIEHSDIIILAERIGGSLKGSNTRRVFLLRVKS